MNDTIGPPDDVASIGEEDSSGRFNFVEIVREHAEREGKDPKRLIWKVAERMFEEAAGGDAAAAKLILDRACGKQGNPGAINVNVDSRSVNFGPPPPASGDMEEYILALSRVAKQIGVEVQETEDSQTELEDLLQ